MRRLLARTRSLPGRSNGGEAASHPDVVTAVLDGDGRLHRADPGLGARLGRTAETLVGVEAASLLAELPPRPWRARIAARLRAGRPWRGDLVLAGGDPGDPGGAGVSDGRDPPPCVLDAVLVPERGSRGELRRITVEAVDVTDARASADRLARSEDRFRLAIEGCVEGLYDDDPATGRCWCSPRFEAMLGRAARPADRPIEAWPELVHPDDAYLAVGAMHAHLVDERPQDATYRMRTEDGGWRWFRVRSQSRRDDAGRATRVVGSISDVDELHRARAAVEEADRATSAFLAAMSHEIRTPMTAILGFADLLDDPTVPGDERARCVDVIRRNGRHLLSVVDDILDLSRIEAGRLELERVPVDVAELAADVVELLRPRAEERGLALAVEHEGPSPGLVASDPVRLRQILVNLVGNAIRFTDEGGVTIRVSWPREPEGRRLRLDVVDTGIGMTAEQLARVFESFVQADASTTRTRGGTGLGLTIARRLAVLLGGDLEARSTPGVGSTFTATVAADPTPASAGRPGGPAEPGDASGDRTARTPLASCRVLVADDEADARSLTTAVLEQAGAIVRGVADGQAALDALEESVDRGEPIDLVVMDMRMPGVDGWAAVRALRSRGLRPAVLACTADAMSGARESCLAAGCDAYLAKPVDRRALLAACLEALGTRPGAPATAGRAPAGVAGGAAAAGQ